MKSMENISTTIIFDLNVLKYQFINDKLLITFLKDYFNLKLFKWFLIQIVKGFKWVINPINQFTVPI